VSPRLELTTRSPEATRELGRRLGAMLPAGAVVALIGSLGSGKTCLVQGLARGLGVPESVDVTSPSYTLIHHYPGRHPLVHIDLYRLRGEADADGIGLFEVLHGPCVAVIEWAERLDPALLGDHLRIELRVAGDERRLAITDCGLDAGDLLRELAARAER
jgi:tRNA threonylcarbamoyladenosine biosynthesis protein TsaE